MGRGLGCRCHAWEVKGINVWVEKAGTHTGNTTDGGPEIGSYAAKYEEVRSDTIFYNVGCAPRNPL